MSLSHRLWVTIEGAAYDETVAFYRNVLGLPAVDGWHNESSRGTVFAIGDSARIEVESAESDGPPHSIALELPDRDALDALHRRLGATQPIAAHRRGHSWFIVRDPSGTEIYMWSEK